MKPEMRIIRTSDTEIVYEIDSLSLIAAEDLELYFKEKPNSTLVFRSDSSGLEDLQILRTVIPQKYFSQIGFLCRKEDLLSPNDLSGCPLSSIVPKNIESFQKVIRLTFTHSFSSVWKEYVGDKIINTFLDILDEQVTVEKGRIIELEGKPVAMIVIFTHSDCLLRIVDQIGWGWIKEDLPVPLRVLVQQLFLHWLHQSHFSHILQAGVHLYNIRPQKSLYRIGFKPQCIHFTLNLQ